VTARFAHTLDDGSGEYAARSPRLWARVANVRRYAELMVDSTSVDRAEMARDVLDILDGRLGEAQAQVPTAADAVLAAARRLCCEADPSPHHAARAVHSEHMAWAEQLADAMRETK
jgi:hypothetical protein